jgi:hypothetical protein
MLSAPNNKALNRIIEIQKLSPDEQQTVFRFLMLFLEIQKLGRLTILDHE